MTTFVTPTNLASYSLLALAILVCAGCNRSPAPPPNVILVITDDQGYGDIAAHGNPVIQTPVLDRLCGESVRLVNFHVDPTCSPTRSALLTGRYSTRTGVWHTIMGRSLMRAQEVTIAEVFRQAGYETGMVGKWHLGDNYPLRPQDQGFDTAFYHPAGGVGQGPDYFGNDYFDDTYVRNGTLEPVTGYVTDVWFDDALAFIDRHQDKPFFLYLATNAPHGPYYVEERYAQPYRDQGVSETMARFYGMITNIDDNMGRLVGWLDSLGLAENTILVFMTDNGSAEGWSNWRNEEGTWTGYNAGMRAGKGSEYDGGHRVPFFVRWPGGNLDGGRDVGGLTAHIDVLPTLAELAGLESPAEVALDGMSLAPQLYGEPVPSRTLFVHSQRIPYPEKWRKSAVMSGPWRLVNQNELYNLDTDPAQAVDEADTYPVRTDSLRAAYDAWWDSLTPSFEGFVHIGIGADEENPTQLNPHDWHVEHQRLSIWNHRQVANGRMGNGFWAIDVTQPGTYTFELRRWPAHLDSSLEATSARLRIGELEWTQDVAPEATNATFTMSLEPGPTTLQATLILPGGEERGAYFVYATRSD